MSCFCLSFFDKYCFLFCIMLNTSTKHCILSWYSYRNEEGRYEWIPRQPSIINGDTTHRHEILKDGKRMNGRSKAIRDYWEGTKRQYQNIVRLCDWCGCLSWLGTTRSTWITTTARFGWQWMMHHKNNQHEQQKQQQRMEYNEQHGPWAPSKTNPFQPSRPIHIHISPRHCHKQSVASVAMIHAHRVSRRLVLQILHKRER